MFYELKMMSHSFMSLSNENWALAGDDDGKHISSLWVIGKQYF